MIRRLRNATPAEVAAAAPLPSPALASQLRRLLPPVPLAADPPAPPPPAPPRPDPHPVDPRPPWHKPGKVPAAEAA